MAFCVVLVFAPAHATAAELTPSWRVIDRAVLELPAGGARAPGDVALDRLDVEFDLASGACAGAADYRLRVGEADETFRSDDACRIRRTFPLGPHRVTFTDAAGRSGTIDIDVRDRLVVSIGDSVASGEGNPDPHGPGRPGWTDRRCHRSVRSAHAVAARAAEKTDPHTSITFVSLACSGATVPNGLLGGADGQEPERGAPLLAAQLDELAQIGATRPIDALLLSIGGNDVDFSSVVKFCARVADCPRRRFDPADPMDEAAPPARTADEVVAASVAGLEGRYRDVATRLAALGIDQQRVLVTEYFDPTQGPDGFCTGTLRVPGLAGGIDAAEARWALASVLQPMNVRIAAAAREHRWRLVDGVAARFRGHGYCAKGDERWVRTIGESLRFHAPARMSALAAGAMHPNEIGHRRLADLLAHPLATVLRTPVPAGTGEDAPPRDRPSGAGATTRAGADIDVTFAHAVRVGGALAVLGGVLLLAGRMRRRGGAR